MLRAAVGMGVRKILHRYFMKNQDHFDEQFFLCHTTF